MSLLVNDETSQIENMFRRDYSFPVNYELTESFKTYKQGQVKILQDNLDLLEEIPLDQNFKAELKKHFKEDIIKSLDNDPLYEKSIEIKKYASNLSKKLHSYFSEVSKFNMDYKRKLHGELLYTSKLFLNSDLPSSFLDAVNDSISVLMDYIDVYTKQIFMERRGLIVNLRNRRKFDRVCAQHNAWVAKSTEKTDRLEHSRLKLIWYVDLNNSNKVEEIFKDKKIRLNRLDESILNQFIEDTAVNITEVQKFNVKMMDYSELISPEFNEPKKTFLKLIEIISKS